MMNVVENLPEFTPAIVGYNCRFPSYLTAISSGEVKIYIYFLNTLNLKPQ